MDNKTLVEPTLGIIQDTREDINDAWARCEIIPEIQVGLMASQSLNQLDPAGETYAMLTETINNTLPRS